MFTPGEVITGKFWFELAEAVVLNGAFSPELNPITGTGLPVTYIAVLSWLTGATVTGTGWPPW